MFTASRNMETNSRYGWGTSGVGIDTHLMKNTEWGAIAYLSSSSYGKTGEIWINPNSNSITGQAGTSASATATTSTYAYNNLNYGINASTTGNTYGVYDMSGGANEYLAAFLNNGNSSLTTYGSSIVNAAAKYKDMYMVGSSDTNALNYEANSSTKGDALYETSSSGSGSTSSWYSEYAGMPTLNNQIFIRGGSYNSASNAGVYYFNANTGNVNAVYGFRPVLAISSGI